EKSRLERKIKYLEERVEASRQEENRRRQDMHALEVADEGTTAETPDVVREEGLLLETEHKGTQPARLIDFSRDFDQRLSGAPGQAPRSAMIMLGRLAGGEPAAFVGAMRLTLCPAVMRHRIGLDWRLLFRILPARIDALDLIPRQDLERRVKILATQYA